MIKEKILDYLRSKDKMSVSPKEMAEDMHLSAARDFRELIKILAVMESDKLLEFNDLGGVSLRDFRAQAQVRGNFHAHPYGYGFVTIDPHEGDVFIAKGKTGSAMEGDEVLLELTKNANSLTGQAAEGVVVGVSRRAVTQLVGTVTLRQGLLVVEARNQKIWQKILVSSKGLSAQIDDIVKVDLLTYPTDDNPHLSGLIVEILGHKGDHGVDVLEILESLGIQSQFPAQVQVQVADIPDQISAGDLQGREDFRGETTYTIDGADAKDLDDAIHVKRLDNGNVELGVHIADVSYYVQEGTAIDLEAFDRGTSVYVTDRVVPMLPERLSNGICSLNPQVDRLTQSCIMEINQSGQVLDYRIVQSVIRTTYRMTYTGVNRMISGDPESLENFSKIRESVGLAVQLHDWLQSMRTSRGAIEFNTIESQILVDGEGRPEQIVRRSRGVAERMIESFMLVANETVAGHFTKLGLPFIYRIHEKPKAEKLTFFIDFAAALGLNFKGSVNQVHNKDLQDFMRSIKGLPDEQILSTMLLRSMQQARYSEKNVGHFGLAADSYTHFTSPIRRYPDLLVHRLIRDYASHPQEKAGKWEALLPDTAKQSSSRERRAVDAEREVDKIKKAEYMLQFLEEEFDGVISSITKFGIFVELENTVEGLVHVNSFKKDYMIFNQRNLTMTSERTGLIFRIGQEVRIRVVRADKSTGEIDFDYIPSDFDKFKKQPKSHRREGGAKGTSNQDKPRIPGKLGNSKKTQLPYYKKAAKGRFSKKKGG